MKRQAKRTRGEKKDERRGKELEWKNREILTYLKKQKGEKDELYEEMRSFMEEIILWSK